MSDQQEKKRKREYRKGHPLPQTEHNRRLREKLILSHKLFKAYVPREIADEFKEICHKQGETMQDMVSMLIAEFNEKNRDK